MASNGNPAWNFGSDNIAPVAPEIFAALAAANEGNVDSYGADAWSARLNERFSAFFGRDVTVFPLATGTAANALALSLLAPPYGAVLCTDIAHIDNDECNAVEFFTGGAKLLGLPTDDGRLDAAQLAGPVAQAAAMGVHNAQPYAVSLTQATEWGTVYGLGALGAITAAARGHGLGVHMDGARFANAVVSLGCAPGAMVAGVDVLSFGATKNGAMAAEAVVIFDPARAAGFAQRRCWRMICGTVTRATPMRRRAGWRRAWATCPACGCCCRWRQTNCSWRCRRRWWPGWKPPALASTAGVRRG
jgi:threonine aldolase